MLLRRFGLTLALAACWCIAAASPVLAVTAVMYPFLSDVGFLGFLIAWAVFWLVGFIGMFALGATKQLRAARRNHTFRPAS